MIFKDGLRDTDYMPADRGVPCVNCGRSRDKHSGWGCTDLPYTSGLFSALKGGEFYLTGGMLASIGVTRNQWHIQYPYRGIAPIAPVVPIPNDAPAAARITFSNTTFKIAEPEDTSRDWRAWRRSTPGECPCGSTPGICPFHQ